MKTRIKATLASVALGWMVAIAAAPPTDEDITRAVETFADKSKALDRSDRQNYSRLVGETAKEALAGIGLSVLSVEQLRQLHRANVLSAAGMTDAVGARLDALAADPGTDGAMAAALRLFYLPSTMVPREEATDADRERAAQARTVHQAALQQMTDHPALSAALAEGAGDVFTAVGRVDRQVMAASGPQMLKLASLITPDFPAEAAPQLVGFFDALARVEDIDAAGRERARTDIVAALRVAQGKTDDENRSRALDRSLEYLDGVFARGELVGRSSPPLDFAWSNHSDPLNSIADLKGKVVVLDFWATWCGPCIASFPNVRELQARYAGYPVVILGVTSLQGSHIDRPGGTSGATERIDTKDNPQQEYELMSQFVQQLDMTWPVAFSAQNVFNPDYGVRGIPHVAILDPQGVVRYRGMHPGGDKAEKHEKIDGLLREFNLPVPASAG
jgi:thiol-disulfide isomerase/thioredoxin